MERRIAETLMRVIASIPRESVLEAAESGDLASYGQRVLEALTKRSDEIQRVLFDSLVQSGEVTAIEIGRDLSQAYRQVNKADAPLPSEVALQFRFNSTDPRAVDWARRETGALITNMVRSEQEAIRQIVTGALADNRSWQQTGQGIFRQLNSVTPSAGVREFADTLGSNLNGLTTRYEQAVINRVTNVADDLASRGITGTKALEAMRKEGDKYATKLRRARSRTIARTERMRAHNQARLLSFEQAIDSGLASREHSRKQWQTGPFDVCNICVPMQGQQMKVSDTFTLPNGAQVASPPAHPNCRCSMTMVTDVRLYDPPETLGTGQPGDPFALRQRQFSERGRELANQPLVNVPMPTVPSQPTPQVDVPAPQPASQFTIDGVEDARTATARLRESRTLAELNDNGLTEGTRNLPRVGNNRNADGVLNLNLTAEGERAVESMLDVGKKARLMLDDELKKRADDLLPQRLKIEADIEDIEVRFVEANERTTQELIELNKQDLQQMLDRIPRTKFHDELEFWIAEADERQLQYAGYDKTVARIIEDIVEESADQRALLDFVDEMFAYERDRVGLVDYSERLLQRIKDGFEQTGRIPEDMKTVVQQTAGKYLQLRREETAKMLRDRVAPLRDEMDEAKRLLKELDDTLDNARISILEEILSTNRPAFGGGDALSKFKKLTGKTKAVGVKELREALREYSRRVPTEWLDAYPSGYTLGFVQRGFYSHLERKIRLSLGSKKGSWRSTLTHEITHGHQYNSRHIQMAERLYLSRRSTFAEYEDTWFRPQKYNRDQQPTFDLGIGDQYTTKIYSDGITELSTRASEMTWYGLEDGVDPEMIDYWLGVLLTL